MNQESVLSTSGAQANSVPGPVVGHIDLRISWGEFGNMYLRFAKSGETKVVAELQSEVAKAFASAEAMHMVLGSLTSEQQSIVSQTITAELTKMGY